MAEEKINLLDLSPAELEKWMADNGAQKYRARQVLQWLYQKGVANLDLMTDLPTGLRDELKANFDVRLPEISKKSEARDGAAKFLLELPDKRTVEAVLLPDSDMEENTLCLSSQVGCKYGCEFCFTATINFLRNLTSGEMLGECLAVKSAYPKDFRIHRLVFMGMGDPLDNFEEVKKAVNLFTSKQGMEFSPRRITLSTAGVIPRIAEAWSLGVNLAISLNAADDARRLKLMPIERKYSIDLLLAALRKLDTSTRQKLTAEYVMLKGVNDSLSDADRLALILRGLNIRINLIRFNPFPACKFMPSDDRAILPFQERLKKAGFMTFIRKSRGGEILAACGQLAGKK